MATVYVLKDPNTKDIVYVGQTKRPLMIRLLGHMTEPGRGEKSIWLKGLMENEQMPIIEAVETVPNNIVLERERYWIKHFKEQGLRLFNMSAGGSRKNAGRKHKYSEATKLITIRVPISKKADFQREAKEILSQWAVNK